MKTTTCPIRVCAHCQKEAGRQPGLNETHGICRRHFVGEKRDAGFGEAQIAASLARKTHDSFCPDHQEQTLIAA